MSRDPSRVIATQTEPRAQTRTSRPPGPRGLRTLHSEGKRKGVLWEPSGPGSASKPGARAASVNHRSQRLVSGVGVLMADEVPSPCYKILKPVGEPRRLFIHPDEVNHPRDTCPHMWLSLAKKTNKREKKKHATRSLVNFQPPFLPVPLEAAAKGSPRR